MKKSKAVRTVGFDLALLPSPKDRTTPTRRERDLLEACQALTDTRGIPPTLTEMATVLSVSLARAVSLAESCERRQWLSHIPRQPRSWKVLEVPAAG